MDSISGAGRNPVSEIEADPWVALDNLQFALGSQLQAALLHDIAQNKDLAGRARLLAGLPQRLAQRRQEHPVPVTVESLRASLEEGGDLGALFAADGPNLGSNLEQANLLYQDLAAAGAAPAAPARYPVLRESGPEDERKQELVWMSAGERQALEQFPSGDSPYPDSVLKTDESGKFPVTWLCLDAWANRKIGSDDLEATISLSNGLQSQSSQDLEESASRIEATRIALSRFLEQAQESGKRAGNQERDTGQQHLEELQREIWLRQLNAKRYVEHLPKDPIGGGGK